MTHPDRTPVLVGIGTAAQREDDFRRGLEPIALMLEAVRAAGTDTGSPAALPGVQWIAVPRGRWRYTNPAGEIGRRIGADAAHTVLTSVGVLQQTLIGEACGRIARGQAHTTLVVGGDAGHRLLRAKIAGERASEHSEQGQPDAFWEPKEELRHPVEVRAGLNMPVGLYALMESAFRHARGWGPEEHRDRLAQLVAQFSQVAADNPDAWTRRPLSAEEVRQDGPRNPMQAFPYNRYHCSSWSVDQAAALLFCSVSQAQALGIARERWIYPLASTESNHMVPVSARARLDECVGARLAGMAALDSAGLRPDQIDLVELYSCFPIAVQAYAQALGLPPDRPMTVTGGMNFAGGPYNNYLFQSTARAARLLREGRGRHALVSCVSGVLTKQGFGLWSREPGAGFVQQDLSDATAQALQTRTVVDTHVGSARVAACTVMPEADGRRRGLLLLDTPQAQRVLATTHNEALVEAMTREEFIGRTLEVQGHEVV
jgi:acetyl-CoA C-acetyltransferase